MTSSSAEQPGTYFNIQRYSVHDGAGIRTMVFLKGCPLHCEWCSNPESQDFFPELGFSADRCIACATCLSHINSGAMSRNKNGTMTFTPQKIKKEDIAVAKYCPSKALICYGTKKNAAEIIDIVERDSIFYDHSGGGMTISGGEPLAQPDFTLALLQEARKRHINTALETCGYADLPQNMRVFALLNELFFDIKHMNAEKHKQFTGKSNTKILNNIKTICNVFPKLHITVRTPVIPSVNDTEEEIAAIAHFVRENVAGAHLELLRFHNFGIPKYKNLARPYLLDNMSLATEKFQELKAVAANIMKG